MEQAENPSSSRGYYCHNCNNTISLPITNFLCPDCHQGFIEKLPDGPASSSSFTDRSSESREDMDSDPVVVLNRVFDDISNNLEVIMGGGESNARNNDSRPSSSSRRDTTSHNLRPNDRRRGRNPPPETYEQMLSDFMARAVQNFDGTGPVLLVGNPGDYAWGREGLDTIVTQLLNQMDSSGPPPLAKDKINELPFVSITAQQVSENIQCSVCWDSFKMTEKVRQLPCDHIYHDLCIVPWLELHGTCPICRKLLSEDNEARLGFPHTGGLEALLSDVHRLSILQRTYMPNNTNRRRQIRCYRCNNLGHLARECNEPPATADFSNGNRSGTRAGRGRRGASSTRSYSNRRHSPSRAVPMHEFLEEFDDVADYLTDSDDYYGSDLENLSDIVPCEACGLTSNEHDFPCNESPYQFDFGENATLSSGWGSPNSANFAGFGGGTSRYTSDQQPRVNNERKRKTTLTCFNCKKPGHLARDCWVTKCVHCSKNHKSKDCWYAPEASPSPFFQPEPQTGWSDTWAGRPTSSWAKRSGAGRYKRGSQWSSDGSGPSTSRSSQPQNHEQYRCFQCNEVGHIARNCPAPKRNANPGRVQYCRWCRREGHFSRECPNF